MRFTRLHLILVLAIGFGLSPLPGTAQTGRVAGVVSLPVSQNKQRAFRGNLYRNRLAPDRGAKTAQPAPRSPFADVVISAHPMDFDPPLETAQGTSRMDQQAATFRPRVLPIRAGATVEFVNQDRFYHNVFSLSRGNMFDLGRKATGIVVNHTFETIGAVEVFCDIHPQMSATVLVLDTKWFTQPDSIGNFQLDGLPDGRYELRAYHPEHDTLKRMIELGGGAPMTQSFVFGR